MIGDERPAPLLSRSPAQFSDGMILAVTAANPTRFDVSPRALVALKSAGVAERVIEAMLAAETAKQQAAVAAAEQARAAKPKPRCRYRPRSSRSCPR